MPGPAHISIGDLLLTGVLPLFLIGLVMALGLGVARTLVIALIRMVLQLSLMGLVLTALFATVSPWLTGAAALVMVGFAGYEVQARQTRRLRHGWALGLLAMALGGVGVTLFALWGPVRPSPWFQPAVALPLLGMVLGNTMTGVALALERLTDSLARERADIEAHLLMGAPMRVAVAPVVRRAIRAGLMPLINNMSAMGLVFLPGMMTGQILAGNDPEQAVRYQMLIMGLLAGGAGLGVVTVTLGAVARLTDARHRLRLDRLG